MAETREARKRRGRILVVDDDAAIRHLVAVTLAQGGFEVEEAGDGADALDKLASGGHDAVVSDLQMPRLSGLSMLTEIRRRGNEIPVIIQTARVDASIENVLRLAGANRVLSKDRMEHLLQSLGEVIGSSKDSPTGSR